jgi:hypothetical protein
VKVLVIPEDPTLDQYILRPIVTKLFADLGRTLQIEILFRPRLRGVSEALDSVKLAGVVGSFPMVDLFLVIVDRDGIESRAAVARAREAEHARRLVVCLAVEEIEVWMLAIHHTSLDRPWREIREEIKPKDRFAHPFLKERAPKLDLGQGRVWAMRELSGQWRGVLDRCPEIKELKRRIELWLDAPL